MNAMTKPKANSRNKGASFEREIAGALFGLTGISFKRNLEQYQTSQMDDLRPSDPAWPFSIECKRYAAGNGCKPAWRAQASASAIAQDKWPAVIYKYDRCPVFVSVPIPAIAAAFGEVHCTQTDWAEISIEGLAYLAGEIMARNAAIQHPK